MIYHSGYTQKFTLPSMPILTRMSKLSKLMEYKNLNISKIDYEFSMK